MDTLVEVRDVWKRYEQLEVLRAVSLSIPASSVVTIVGPSGAGKTTLLQILGTMLRPDAGQVRIGGTDAFALRGNRLAHFRRICFSVSPSTSRVLGARKRLHPCPNSWSKLW